MMNTKRRIVVTGCLLIVCLAVVAVITLGLLGGFDSDNGPDQEPAAVTSSRNTATVTKTDFVKETEIDGTLGFGDVESLPNLSSGIVTWLPEPGSVIGFGDVIYKINDEPVILLHGTMPMFRDIDENTSSARDVAQLQTYFVELGFSDTYPVARSTYDLSTDRYVTSITLSQIEQWQESVGVDRTGVVKKSQIVFRPEPFRVDAITARLGQSVNGGSLINITEARRVVTVHLDTELGGLIAMGDIVEVELPDGNSVEGTVTHVADVATRIVQGQQQTTYLDVVIELLGSGASFDQSPVTVKVEEVLEQDAVAVPIAALLALAEGGYGLEVLDPDNTVRLVGVELGTFHGNQVSISRGVQPGQSVIIP